jgi:phosphoesterase RecJ-like protein
MPKKDAIFQLVDSMIQSSDSIMVISHIRPDGDAIGALLGFGLTLLALGKKVQMISADGVPSRYRHLEGSEWIKKKPDGEFDLICVLDCSDIDRTGKVLDDSAIPDLNIDHHITNLNFAQVNLVDTKAVATVEILYDLFLALDLPLSKPVSAALLTGLLTDTIGFRTNNMTPKAFRVAADLMEQGVQFPELYRRVLVDRSFEATRYWGTGLVNLERDDHMVWTSLSLSARKTVNYPGRDDADLINLLSSINDVDIAIVFVEQPDDKVKVSWRSRPGIDVSKIAFFYGGGGHASASGAEIKGRLEDIQKIVLDKTKSLIMN